MSGSRGVFPCFRGRPCEGRVCLARERADATQIRSEGIQPQWDRATHFRYEHYLTDSRSDTSSTGVR